MDHSSASFTQHGLLLQPGMLSTAYENAPPGWVKRSYGMLLPAVAVKLIHGIAGDQAARCPSRQINRTALFVARYAVTAFIPAPCTIHDTYGYQHHRHFDEHTDHSGERSA